MLPKISEEGVTTKPPSFPDMVSYFHKRAAIMLQSGDCFATAAGKLPFAPAIMSGALSFVRLCLEESAGVREEDRLTGSTLSPVSLYLAGLVTPGQTCIDQYLELLVQSLGPAGGTCI